MSQALSRRIHRKLSRGFHLLGGLLSTGLDAIPYVGALKNGIELFTGDFIPDRPPSSQRASAPSVDEASRAVRRWP